MKTYLEPEEVNRLEDAATNLRDRLLVRLLFFLGCRISEALALTTDNINFSSSTVTINHLKRRIKLSCPFCSTRLGKGHVFCPKCGKRVGEALTRQQEQKRFRSLPIDSASLSLLKTYIDRGGPVIRNGKRFIFGINRHRAWQIFKECAERAGLPKLINPETGKLHNISPHKLRDAFAVNAVKHDDSGDGLRMLQEHLGHQNFNTTAKYSKVSGEEHKEWYGKLWGEHNGH